MGLRPWHLEVKGGLEVFSERLVEGCRPFHDLSAGETAAPDLSGECGGGKTPLQISRRKDPAYLGRESLGAEEKTSRTRDIHSKSRPGYSADS